MLVYFVLILVFVVVFLYHAISSKNTFFKNRGVPQTEPKFFFGDFKDVILKKAHDSVVITNLYNTSRRFSYIGFYQMTIPTILLIDLEIVRKVLITDFSYFYNNSTVDPDPDDPFFSLNVFAARDDTWKKIRSHMTPMMTSNKIKSLFSHLESVGDNLVKHIAKYCDQAPAQYLDIEELAANFTTDVIASTVFSAKVNSFNTQNVFRQISRKVFLPATIYGIPSALKAIYPFLGSFSKSRFFADESCDLVMKLTKETLIERQISGNAHNDFLQQLIVLKNKNDLSDTYIAAQVFGFFIDGYGTSAVVILYTLFEIGKNIDVQEKLRREIDEMYEATDGKFTYDDLFALTYTEKVLMEVQRMQPTCTRIERVCTKPYTLQPASSDHKPLTIQPGMRVFISVLGMHMDERYFPNPERFNPENFTPEAIALRPKHCYLPFGDGPRICFGMRLGMAQVKYFISMILRNFEVYIAPHSLKTGYSTDPKSMIKMPDGKLFVSFKSRS